MAPYPRRSGNTGLIQPKLRRQARVILFPLKCDGCEMEGPQVNQDNFITDSRILCDICKTSCRPCVRCGGDALSLNFYFGWMVEVRGYDWNRDGADVRVSCNEPPSKSSLSKAEQRSSKGEAELKTEKDRRSEG